jgi:Icc-related predicted phosphoesterase
LPAAGGGAYHRPTQETDPSGESGTTGPDRLALEAGSDRRAREASHADPPLGGDSHDRPAREPVHSNRPAPEVGSGRTSGLTGSFPDFLADGWEELRTALGRDYPRVFLILGNDDGRRAEEWVLDLERRGLWTYLHDRRVEEAGHVFHGYAYVPPTPFLLKDWERYDVSRYVDPGCVSPEEGLRTVEIPQAEARWATIAKDLARLAGPEMERAVFLFHTPPHRTNLDRAALDGMSVDGVPLDPHVGSIAVRRFIEERQPLVTMHGHIHESARIMGSWRDRIGRTEMFSAAHDGPGLALVTFDLADPGHAERQLL